MTSEHVYQSEKFEDGFLQEEIRMERSAHTAFTRAQELRKDHIRSDWDAVKVSVMKEILHHKVTQHSFVRDTLMSTEERDIIEDSPVDAFWGWGPNKDGKNMLGKLWMEVREEVRKSNDL